MSSQPRLLLLAAAGALLVGFGVFWVYALKDKKRGGDDLDDDEPEEEKKEEEEVKDSDDVKAEFNVVKHKAFELFKAHPPNYAEAAVSFTRAIELANAHSGLASQRVALYNNRSACRERCSDLEASLSDCAVVLASNAMHSKVRRRQARIYEKLGRYGEALTEICADLLIQREGFKKAFREGKPHPEQPTPVENVETVMRAVGKEAADKIIVERGPEGCADFGMPSVNTVTQLLMTYATYSDRVEAAEKEISDGELAELIKKSATKPEEMTNRLRRAEKLTYTKRYTEAAKDVDASLLLIEEASPAPLRALLWRFVGLYRHLVHDLEGARAAYGTSLESESVTQLRIETRVKRAGVLVDAGEMALAETELAEALAERSAGMEEVSSDVFMHRAQLHVIRRDLVSAQRDLETCIKTSPRHVLALLRLATVLIHNGAAQDQIEKHILAAERLAPSMSEVYQVKGEILLARSDLVGAITEFDKAISLDKHNPVPLYNKGLAIMQMNPAEAQQAEQLFEAALKADPTCMVALMRLSELRLQLAASFEQAQLVVEMLGDAMLKCRDKDELVELSTVHCMAIAQLAAAKAVGLTNFQM